MKKKAGWQRMPLMGLLPAVALSLALTAHADFDVLAERSSEHNKADDLLTAGLGLAGLRAAAPDFDDPDSPGAAELRRLALHNAWNALAFLSPAGGLGDGGVVTDLPPVAGTEISALLQLPEARHPFRVVVQIPAQPVTSPACLLVAPASGSRGIYGAAPLAGPAALLKGCALAYTDKGAGTDFHTLDDDLAPDLSGVRTASDAEAAPFRLADADTSGLLAMKHAHSGDHPEADWGRHVLAAAQFARERMVEQLGKDVTVRVLAVGLSNGGAAALHAAEVDVEGLLDGVVAVMPNITPPEGAPLYDYASLAALFQPCVLADGERIAGKPLANPMLVALGQQRCDSLAAAGLLTAADPAEARGVLLEAGFDDQALRLGPGNVALDLWRGVAVSYASAYLRRGPADMPCGYALHAADATEAQRAAWWASHSGIGPGNGVELVDGLADGDDSALPGLRCLRSLWTAEDDAGAALRAAVEETRASARLPDIPVLIIHGRDDGLIPATLSSRPYVAAARAQGADQLAYWEIDGAQHFDAFLNVPGVADHLVPILPYGWVGIEHVLGVLEAVAELGSDRGLRPTPGASVLTRELMMVD